MHDIFNPLKIPRLIKPKSITPTDFEDKWVVLDGPKGQSYKFNKAIINPVCGIDCYKMDKSHIDNTLSEMNIGIIVCTCLFRRPAIRNLRLNIFCIVLMKWAAITICN